MVQDSLINAMFSTINDEFTQMGFVMNLLMMTQHEHDKIPDMQH